MSDDCPECGAELEYDEVDIGVGTMRGNPGCPECGWTPPRVDDGLDDDIRDASGRLVAPPQPEPAPRPAGPHTSNHDAREPVRE